MGYIPVFKTGPSFYESFSLGYCLSLESFQSSAMQWHSYAIKNTVAELG